MQFPQVLTLLSALAVGVLSQSTCTQTDGSCNTQNGNTSTNSRIIVNTSTVQSVYTPVATSTYEVVSTTSLPHSLNTVTSAVLVTSQSVYTTNTLNNAAATTTAVVATTTSHAGAAGSVMNPAGGAAMVLLAIAAAL